MAILDRTTMQYIKVNFEDSKIQGNGVFPAYVIYKTAAEREKEKARQNGVRQFLERIDGLCEAEESAAYAEMQRMGVTQTQIFAEDGTILDAYPTLKEHQDKLTRYNGQRRVTEHLYVYGNDPIAESSAFDFEFLASLGFDRTWITDPVRIEGSATIYRGEYDNAPIDTAYYYNKLKPAFLNEIEDV